MPLDPSIALSVRNPRIEYNQVNPINAMLQGEQLRGAREANALRRLQMQQSQREMEQEEVRNRLLAGAISPEGEIDYNRVIQGLAGAGQAGKIPELLAQRGQADVRKAQLAAAQAAQQREGLEKALSFLGRANEQNYPAVRQFMVQMAPGVEGLLPAAYDKASIDALAGRMEQQVKESADLANMKALGFPLTPEGYQQYMSSRFQPVKSDVLSPEAEAQKIRLAQASRPPPTPREPSAPRTQRVELNDGSIGLMNMDTGQITRATVGGEPAKARPSAFAEKAQSQRAQLARDLDTAISELKDAVKPKGLIDQSTGSGAGRLVDVGARFFGEATKGDIAIGKLAPISDLVLKMVPRFEGPQSDKDTKSYKEAAGQLSDATLPRDIRKQAALTIIRLMENRKEQFVTKDMADSGAPPAAPKGASGEWTVVR